MFCVFVCIIRNIFTADVATFVSSLMTMSLSTSSYNLAMLYTTELYPVQHIGTILGVCVGSGTAFYMVLFSIEYFVRIHPSLLQ